MGRAQLLGRAAFASARAARPDLQLERDELSLIVSLECYFVFWPVVCAGGFDVVCWSLVLAAHTIRPTTTSTAMTAEAIVPLFQGPSTL